MTCICWLLLALYMHLRGSPGHSFETLISMDLSARQGSKWCLDHAAGRQTPAQGYN